MKKTAKIKMLILMMILAMSVVFAPAAAMAEESREQNIQIEKLDRTVRYHLLEAGSRSLKVLNVRDAQTALSFSKVSGVRYFKVAEKTGKITIGRGTPVGEYSVRIRVTAAASLKYKKFSKNVTVRITVRPGIQPVTVTKNNRTVKYSNVKKANVTLKNVLRVEGAVGTVRYKKVSGTDWITVDPKTGAVTVKKGTPKSTGTYRIGIKVTAAGNSNYLAAKRSRTVHITVS